MIGDGEAEDADRIDAALGANLDDGEVLTGWVIAATYLDADGNQRVYCQSNPGAMSHATLGLLEYVAVGERQTIAEAFRDADDAD